MLAKVVAVLACVYVARGAIVTAYQDDNELTNPVEEEVAAQDGRGTCNAAQCNKYCHESGFASGYCTIIFNQCRCRRWWMVDIDRRAPELTNAVKEEAAAPDVRGNCWSWQCDQFCRNSGFAGGSCIGTDQCRCRMSLDSSDNVDVDVRAPELTNAVVEEAAAPDVLGTCWSRECNDFCRKRRYSGGTCVGPDQCRCYMSFDSSADVDVDVREPEGVLEQTPDTTRKCNSSQCNQICQRLGFAGGACVAPNVCQCRSKHIRDSADGNVETDATHQSPELGRSSCVNSQCDQICRKLGFAGGVCIRPNVCQCRIGRDAKSADNALMAILLFSTDIASGTNLQDASHAGDAARPRDSCNLRWCEQTCRRMGFRGGVCVNGHCKCDLMRSASTVDATFPEVIIFNTDPRSDIELNNAIPESDRKASCVNSQCNEICRRLGFKGGACVSANVCQCHGRRIAPST